MSYIEWSPKFETGISIIDSQHRTLISILNQVEAASLEKDVEMRSLIIKLNLQHLVEYTKYHFESEEKLMSESHYSNFDEHKKEHHDLRLKVEKIVEKFSSGEDVLSSLILFLQKWLQHHILESDMAYVPELKK